MSAPTLSKTQSLSSVEDGLVFTEAKLRSAGHGPEAARIAKLVADCAETHLAWRQRRQDVVRAQAQVTAADEALDDFVGRFVRAAGTMKDGAALLASYCAHRTPSEFARPVLGDQLATMKKWPARFATEKAAGLSGLSKELGRLLAQADKALEARRDAEAKSAHFRDRGGLAAFFVRAEKVRAEVAEAVERHAREKGLGRSYGARFWMHDRRAESAADRAAKAAARAAARAAKADEARKLKEARDKVKAAMAEVRKLRRKG